MNESLDAILAALPRPDGRDDLRAAQEAAETIEAVAMRLRVAIYLRTPDTLGIVE